MDMDFSETSGSSQPMSVNATVDVVQSVDGRGTFNHTLQTQTSTLDISSQCSEEGQTLQFVASPDTTEAEQQRLEATASSPSRPSAPVSSAPRIHDESSGEPSTPTGAQRSRTFSSAFSATFSSDSIGVASSDVDAIESFDECVHSEPAHKKVCASPTASSAGAAGACLQPKQARGGRGLRPEGRKEVGGFEACGLWVARCNKKLPKTQSWCFVPLIFSALGNVPEWLRQDGISTAEQIEAAQPVWSKLFSHWASWREELRRIILARGQPNFEQMFLPKAFGQKSWTTSLVFGEPRTFGKLPHPQGPKQDQILSMLPCDTQNQIFASVVTISCS